MSEWIRSAGWPVVAAVSLCATAGDAAAHEATQGLEAYLARQDKTYVCQVTSGAKPATRLLPAAAARQVIAGGGHLGPCATRGDRLALGNGHVTSYVQLMPDGTPWAIGFEFAAATMDNLPQSAHDGLNCFDVNGDGDIDLEGARGREECVGGHSLALQLPRVQGVAPFKWGLINWNPRGHEPHRVYDKAHFDFHFYTQSYLERNMIRVGPCGLLVDCEDFAKGRKTVPAGYMHDHFLEVGAVESRMGNHLIDVTAHEWDTHGHFTQTWLYGTYNGKVTNWEPMITRDYLLSRPFMCQAIKLPQRYMVAGQYPTEYCIRYRAERRDYTVSLEGFVARAAN